MDTLFILVLALSVAVGVPVYVFWPRRLKPLDRVILDALRQGEASTFAVRDRLLKNPRQCVVSDDELSARIARLKEKGFIEERPDPVQPAEARDRWRVYRLSSRGRTALARK